MILYIFFQGGDVTTESTAGDFAAMELLVDQGHPVPSAIGGVGL